MNQTNLKTLVCIANLGSIKSTELKDIRFFLKEFLSDRRVVNLPKIIWYPILFGIILPFRAKKLQKKYQSIWLNNEAYQNCSPLIGYTKSLIKNLNQNNQDKNLYFDYAMSYIEAGSGHNLDSLFHQYKNEYERFLVVPLYPHFSTTTTNALTDQLLKLKQAHPKAYKRIELIKSYSLNEEFVETIAKSIKEQIDTKNKNTHLLFSYHSIPQKCVDDGDSYQDECIASTHLIAQNLKLTKDQYSISFQSRFGKAKWLEPATDTTVENLAKKGIEHLAVVCPGFSMDCLETLEEINMEAREIFLTNAKEKSEFTFIPCLNDSSAHTVMIEKIALSKLSVFQNF